MKINLNINDITKKELNRTSVRFNNTVNKGVLQLLRNIYNEKMNK